MLCPILFAVPGGLALVMKRATPISEDEAHQLRGNFGFPDWDYVPPDDECPFEPKASDWGHLSDGRLVALDYSPVTPCKLEAEPGAAEKPQAAQL